MEEPMMKLGVLISKKIVVEWYNTISHNKNTRHPVRERLEEALKDNIEKFNKKREEKILKL